MELIDDLRCNDVYYFVFMKFVYHWPELPSNGDC